MAFNNDDREYARPIALPSWLKDFADRELKKSSPFEEIKNIFNKHDPAAVEAKVQELQKMIGLNLIEKKATIRHVERAKERGEGTTMKWCVYPKGGGEALGCHDTKEDAQEQLQAIEANKANDFYIQKVEDKIHGGFGDGHDDKRYDADQLEKGIKVELEHTSDPAKAKEIAKDHLEESKDFKGERGGKYYDKLEEMEECIEEEIVAKKARLDKLIFVANKLDQEGNFSAAVYIDKQIQKLAAEITLEKLERLPIMPVEMWTDFQLTQAANQPELFEGQEGKLEEVKKEVAKRMQRKGIKAPDIGKWRDYGWWGLWFMGLPLGYLNNGSALNLIKQNLVNRFAEQGLEGLMGSALSKALKGAKIPIIIIDNATKKVLSEEEYSDMLSGNRQAPYMEYFKQANEYADSLLNNPNFKDERRECLEKALDVKKMHENFEEPYKDAIITGGVPTQNNYEGAVEDFEGIETTSEYIDDYDEVVKDMRRKASESYEEGEEAIDKLVERHVARISSDMLGRNPEEMADDPELDPKDIDLPWLFDRIEQKLEEIKQEKEQEEKEEELKKEFELSCRDGMEADDKSVFEKYPGIQKHIDNICQSRQGYIDVPALLDIIKTRPEKLTDKELKEIKEYTEKKIKEEKKDLNLEKDDDVIGLYEATTFVVNEEDDGNSEVFSKPSRV